MVLDDGSNWEPEDFQLEVVKDLLAGVPETWLVIPEGNGKTTLLSGFALYHGDYTPEAMVVVGAASRDQCEVLHNQGAGFIRRTPGLSKRFRVFDGYRRIKCLRTNGKIQVFAADDRTGDGVIYTMALLDELHRQRDLRLYRTWKGKRDKRGGQMVAISTAGEADSEFEQIRKRVRTEASDIQDQGAYVRAAGNEIVLHDYMVVGDVEDMAAVKAANPLSTITVSSLRAKRHSDTMSLHHWRRFNCNQAVQQENSVISEKEWGACEDADAEPAEGTIGLTIGIDLGWKHDTTAIVPVYAEDDQVAVGKPAILYPPRDGTALQVEVILAEIRKMAAKWPEATFVLDPEADGEILAQTLDNEGFRVATHSQKPTPMALAAQRLSSAISSGRLKHTGDPELTRHVLAVAAKPVGEGFRFVRPRSGVCIDGCISLAMAVSVATAQQTYNPDDYRIERL